MRTSFILISASINDLAEEAVLSGSLIIYFDIPRSINDIIINDMI